MVFKMLKLTLAQIHAKSAKKIATLEQPLRTIATLLVDRCYARGIMILITEGKRTIHEQNVLYSKGRTTKQLRDVGIYGIEGQPNAKRVTKAVGGKSNHNFGFAFDFALILPNGVTVVWDTLRSDNLDSLPDWSEVVIEAKKLGLEWGGDWRSFVDLPHFQMVFGLTTAQFRAGLRPTGAQIQTALDKMRPIAVAPVVPIVKESEALLYDFVAGDKVVGNAFIYGNISYVPMRALAEYIGVPFVWDNEEKRAYFNATATDVLAGTKKYLDDVKLIGGSVYVQLRPLATAYGKTLTWDPHSKKVGVK